MRNADITKSAELILLIITKLVGNLALSRLLFFLRIIFLFPIQDAVTETLILFLVSKSAISASFLIIYPFAGELYPTQLRGVAIGFSAYISGLGLIIIPFVTYLVSFTRYLSFTSMMLLISFYLLFKKF